MDADEPGKIYTIGYGISSEQEFVDRLRKAFPDGDGLIIDIRKEGSGSWNGNWAQWGYQFIGDPVRLSGNDYLVMPELANHYGSTKRGLNIYETELERGSLRRHLDELVRMIKDNPETKYCLMCCERKPYTGKLISPHMGGQETYVGSWTGHANCHRTIIAANVTAQMHFRHQLKYKAVHLYTERAT